uniref:Uncharacterized protein n=1 Tax=Oryza rufipogon TaxID=4529 RepID=A0A0E0MV63_ORYRU
MHDASIESESGAIDQSGPESLRQPSGGGCVRSRLGGRPNGSNRPLHRRRARGSPADGGGNRRTRWLGTIAPTIASVVERAAEGERKRERSDLPFSATSAFNACSTSRSPVPTPILDAIAGHRSSYTATPILFLHRRGQERARDDISLSFFLFYAEVVPPDETSALPLSH